MPMSMASLSSLLFVKMPRTLACLHEGLLRVPTPFIWSLQPYGAAVPSSLIQCILEVFDEVEY